MKRVAPTTTWNPIRNCRHRPLNPHFIVLVYDRNSLLFVFVWNSQRKQSNSSIKLKLTSRVPGLSLNCQALLWFHHVGCFKIFTKRFFLNIFITRASYHQALSYLINRSGSSRLIAASNVLVSIIEESALYKYIYLQIYIHTNTNTETNIPKQQSHQYAPIYKCASSMYGASQIKCIYSI